MTKVSLLTALFVVSVFSSSVFATSTVCSSEQLYFSDIKKDLGMQPLPGTVLGTRVIVYERKILVNHEFIKGLGQGPLIPYQVELKGEEDVLEETGDARRAGSRTFKQKAVLSKMILSKAQKIASEEVVCKSTWEIAQ